MSSPHQAEKKATRCKQSMPVRINLIVEDILKKRFVYVAVSTEN